ncbi:MAG: serine/threonine-protein kinase [Verrucomicrobiota bacterium]
MTTHDSPPPVCPRCGTSLQNDAPEGLCPRCLAAINFETGSLLTGAGASLPPPPIEEIAPHFPQLEILTCLGRGGMGVVYKARQISLDRLVALKLLAPEREKDPEFSERFAREAQALAKMSHPHIVTVHDFGQAGGFFYLLMEYVDGANLRQLLQAHKFTPEQALAVVPPLCDALQYAHDRGIVHRDIKPENLLIDRDGKVKVADFGLAKMLGTDASGDERPVGTPSYMAPEQTGDPVNVDNRADIYSLGVVIYEMLTGELPGKNFQPPSSKAAIDARLDEVVQRAMEQEPDQRYQQASMLKTEVERISQVPPLAPPLPQVPMAEGADSPQVLEDVRLPAIAMMVASGLAICSQLFGVMMILMLMVFPMHLMNQFSMPLPVPFLNHGANLVGVEALILVVAGGWMLLLLGVNIASLIGANRMRKRESYPWAVASAVILIAVGVLSLPGMFSRSFGSLIILAQLAAGIWGLVVLMRDEVKAVFDKPLPALKSAELPTPGGPEVMKRKLAIPSIGLMAASAMNLLFLGLMLLTFLLRATRGGPAMANWVVLLLVPLIAIPSIITFIGSWRMRELKGYTLAIAAAVLALITPPGLLIGVIFGVWALIVLFDKDVRVAFQGENPNGSSKGCLVAAAIVAAVLFFLVVAVPVGIFYIRFQNVRTFEAMGQRQEFPQNPVPPPSPPYLPIYPPPAAAESGPSADLAARYEASRTILDFTVRDSSLAGIARDAAASGNPAIAKQALKAMVDFTSRDEARKAAALLLCDRGMRNDAVEIAKQITDFTKRDETLTELSTRKPLLEAIPGQ